jgi:phage tail protein X
VEPLPRRRFGGVDPAAVEAAIAAARSSAEAELAALRERLAAVERERDEAVARQEAREAEITNVLRIATEVAAQTTGRAQQEAESIRGDARSLHADLVSFAGAVQDLVARWGPVLRATTATPVAPTPAPAPAAAPAPAPPPEPYSMTLVASPVSSPEQVVDVERALVALDHVTEARLERLDAGEAHFHLVVTADLAASGGLAHLGTVLRSGLDGYVLVLGRDQATR